jgi:hypothetical protein
MSEPFFPADLVAFVARSAGLTPEDLLGPRKFAPIVRARAVAAKVLHERGTSYSRIAKILRKDHTTIMYAMDTFDERFAHDPVAQEMLDYARYEFLDEVEVPAPRPATPVPDVGAPAIAMRLRPLEVGDIAYIPVSGRRDIKRAHHRVSQYGLRTDKGFRGRINADKTFILFTRVR